MDIRRFRIFQMVAEQHSFTKAAHMLYMSQPAVSKAISELEEELQSPLFERFPKSVSLTPEGVSFLALITPLLTHYHDVLQHATEINSNFLLRIGSSITIANENLCSLLKQLQKTFPTLQQQIEVASSASIVVKLKQQKLDIAFVEGILVDDAIIRIPLSSYQILPVASPAFLKQHPVSDILTLVQQPLLLREEGSAIREVVDSALLLHDVTAVPAWTSTNSSVLLKAAITGFGITFLPAKMVQKKLHQQALQVLALPALQLENHNHIIYLKHKHQNEAMRQFITMAQQGL